MKYVLSLCVLLCGCTPLLGKQVFADDFRNKAITDQSMAPLPTKVNLTVLKTHGNPVSIIRWSPDNKYIATVSKNWMFIWNAETGMLLDTTGSGEEIDDIAWANDSKRIAMTHHNDQVWICHLDNVFEAEKELKKLDQKQRDFVNEVVSSPDIQKLTVEQQKIFDTLPAQIKWGVQTKLDMYKPIQRQK